MLSLREVNMKNTFYNAVKDMDAEALKAKYKIGVFQGKDHYAYRSQFYFLFGSGSRDSIKNPKSLMKEWFNQVSLDGKPVRLCVNKTHNIQLSESPVLRQLIKEKHIKVVRTFDSPRTRYSYLVKNQ